MIGRAPMMMQPQFIAPPMQTFPGPQVGQQQWQQPRVQQPAQPPQQAAVRPPLTAAQQQQPVQPIVARGKPYDEPAPQAIQPFKKSTAKVDPLALPSPEELGVAPAVTPSAPQAAKVDWNATHDRLQKLGGTAFQSAQLGDGSYRVGFVLRTNQADQVHHIEATAATEAEAGAVALGHAEQWAFGRP
jgi:hypothetical protein